jgi:hypothetical protein
VGQDFDDGHLDGFHFPAGQGFLDAVIHPLGGKGLGAPGQRLGGGFYGGGVVAVGARGKGEQIGGPMYAIKNGLGKRWRWLAPPLPSSAGWPASASATWSSPTASPARSRSPSASTPGSPVAAL